jgi:hypothetical protein
VVAVITSLSYDIQRAPAEVIIEGHDRKTMVITTSSVPLDFLDVEAVQSSFTDLYFGAHEVKVNGQKLVHVRDFRLLPAPWGARLLFIRPVHAKSISLSLDSRINFTPRRNGVLAGTYHFIFELPRWIGYDSKGSGLLYQLGTKIYANEPSFLADSVFGPGWSNEEQWGRWSDGSDAVLVVRLMQPATSDLALYMRAGAFLAAGLPQQRVKVFVNDQPVKLLTFWEVGVLRDIIVPLSLDLIAGAKQLTIRLNMPDAHSPASLGLSSDRRKLGLGLEWVMIAPAAVGN